MGLSGDDYAKQLDALLPTGLAWSKDRNASLRLLTRGLAEEFSRVDGRADELLNEILPDTTFEMLSDWERTAGLPDTCVATVQTVQERRAALIARLTSQGGQSAAFFIALAKSLGYTVTITEFRQFTADHGRAGDAVYGDDWLYAWRINGPAQTITYFRADQSTAEEPLAKWGNDLLECVFKRIKPAHTVLLFGYGTVLAGPTQFGVGDGVSTTFQLMDGTKAVTNPNVTAIYREDWQGNQLLSPLPRTNYAPAVEAFSQYLGTVITPNSAVAPDGTMTAATVAYQSGAGGNLYYLLSNPSNTPQVQSEYFKANTIGAQLVLGNDKMSPPAVATFNLFAGTVVSSSGGAVGSIESKGNGWYRCIVKFTEPASMPTGDSFVTQPLDRPGTIYQWAPQSEQGNSATPVIVPGATAPKTQTDYSLGSGGSVTFAAPPPVGAILRWTGSY